MKNFFSLADEKWLMDVDVEDAEVAIYYRDPERPRCFVGPLAVLPVGTTVVDEEGDEALELCGADGRNLAAVACLPQMARLCKWVADEYEKLGVSEDDAYNRFVDKLKDRVDWITACIDERPETMGSGTHSFEPYRGEL